MLAAAGTLERSEEVATIDAMAAAAAAGEGGLLVIQGPPGIGKTRLLTDATKRAAEPFEVLMARGDELEAELPFGMVRQLFEARLTQSSKAERSALLAGAARLATPVLEPSEDPAPGRPEAVMHGLYWLTVNISAKSPLALVLDDLHWGDTPSLEWLRYLVGRLDGLPVLVLAGCRPGEGERAGLIDALVARGDGTVVTPRPLSDAAVGDLIRDQAGAAPDDAFTTACARATGGNPFLLRELLRAVARESIPVSAVGAEQVSGLAPATIARSVLLRLAALPPAATELAQAVAVMGETVELELASELAGIAREEAAESADALAAAHVLDGGRRLAFVHPIVRASIEEAMPPSQRRDAHARAARLLAREGAGPERRAVHLLVADPSHDPDAVTTLRQAARIARERGAARIAVTYLSRALEEPPEEPERAWLLEELGVAAAAAADPRAVDWLRAACVAAESPAARARAGLALGRALQVEGRLEEAFAAIDETEADLGGHEGWMAARLEAELVVAARLDHRLRPRVPERLRRLERLSRDLVDGRLLLLAQRAYEGALAGEPAEGPAAMAEESFDGGRLLELLGPEDPSVYLALNSLSLCERLDEAREAFDAVVAEARERGSALGFAIASCFRAQVHHRRGDLRRAEADARAAVEVARIEGWGLGIPAARGFLVAVLIDCGALDEAREVLDEAGLGDEIPDLVTFDPLLEARGRLKIATGETAEGLADLLACGERQDRWGALNPSVIPWRSAAAESMLRTGRVDAAAELADEEVRLARRFGTPRALGMALRVAGLVRGQRDLLTEAVEVLEGGPSPLETARARVALGAALQRQREPRPARQVLRQALDAADRAGAGPLAEEAREELVAAGARPRRARLSGRDALTASELRVATRAAEGRSNREIAQALFVTVKTIEAHLGNAYRKLGIASRAELAAALEQAEG